MDELSEEQWFEQVKQQVLTVPPSCLNGFKCSPASFEEDEVRARWSLACHCGSKQGSVLGYPLKDLNPDYDGEPLYVSPLSLRCSGCDDTIEILDTKQHGYNSEIDKLENQPSFDSNYRGSGDPSVIPCPECNDSGFEVTAVFYHTHFDLVEDEPELEPRAQDFFDAFELRGNCTSCGAAVSLASFELA